MPFLSFAGRSAAYSRLPQALTFAIVVALSAAGLPAAPALAAGGLVVTPQLVELDSRTRSQVLTLANRGDQTETYRISIVNYRMDDKGNLHPTEQPADGEGFAGALFRYAPRQITLEPGRPQTVRILYRRPANLQEGEYRSHLLFQQVPPAEPTAAETGSSSGLSLQIRTVFGITVPVIIRHGTLQAEGGFKLLEPAQLGDGSPAIKLRIARSGAMSLRGDLVARIGDEEVGRLNNVAVYLSTPHRDVFLPLDPESLSQVSGREVSVEYSEREERGGASLAVGQLRLP
jgi:P pilus assembly chaperone PapD